MSGAHILARVRTEDGRWVAVKPGLKGPRRYIVRWRRGGRSSKLNHAGSFATQREAEACRRRVLDELAAGRDPTRNPRDEIEDGPSVREVVRRHIEARVDVDERTRANYGFDLERLPAWLQVMRVGDLTPGRVQDAVNEMDRAPAYGPPALLDSLGLLRGALRRAGLRPNPADSELVTSPTYRSPEVRPPSAADLLRLAVVLPEHWRRTICILEGSGLRVGEAARLLPRDVDRERSRLLVRRERTKGGTAGERWVPLRPAVMAMVPRAEGARPVLDFRPHSLREAMRVRVRGLGMDRVTPHFLRHRYASRLVLQGVPITLVRERLGHAHSSMTLDVYSHVLLDDGLDPVLDLADLLA